MAEQELEEVEVKGVNCSSENTQNGCKKFAECFWSEGICKRKCEKIPDEEACTYFGCYWISNQCSSCSGIKLNTDIPFIGDCIGLGQTKDDPDTINGKLVSAEAAFPTIIGALMKILTSAMMIIGLIMIIAAGVLMTTEGVKVGNFKMGRNMILKVGAVLALLGLSGIILKLINPTFFI